MKQVVAMNIVLAAILAFSNLGFSAEEFVIHAPGASIAAIANHHGLTVVKEVKAGSDWVVVSSDPRTRAQIMSEISKDSDVQNVEPNQTLSVPEVNGGAELGQSTAAILDNLAGNEIVPYYGSNVWSVYVNQKATASTHLADVQKIPVTGSGTIAIIDTGVDDTNPVLQGSLVPGYDFVHDIPGTASEWIDVSPATAAALSGSAPAVAAQGAVVRVNQSTAAILDQSTAAILDIPGLPAAFGHGTMVAGVVHLVAPTAKIMPLKAFAADGSAKISDIVRAIYYATDNGAGVINMSFSTATSSIGLVKAINYAIKHGVICVASTGNDGMETLVYPAGLHSVIGVASTDKKAVRSRFSNYGPALTQLAAPGEQIVTTYPGGSYAIVSGTSFAAPFVSGAAALLHQVDDFPGQAESIHALCSDDSEVTADLGCGLLDLYQAVTFFMSPDRTPIRKFSNPVLY